MHRLRDWAKALKREVVSLWFAYRDPRTPRLAKVLAALVVAYALSPIDLIPDFIPVLGYLDDVILLPALIWLTIRLLPADVLDECRAKAERWLAEGQAAPRSRVAGAVIVLIWIAASAAAGWLLIRAAR